MGQERGPQHPEGLLHSFPEMLPHPAPFLQTLLVILFQPTFVGVGGALGETGAMQKAVEQHELAVKVGLHQGPEVEFHIGGPSQAGGIPQQPQLVAVGHQTPEGVGAVQVFLDQGVGAAAGLAPLVQPLVMGDDMDGWGFGSVPARWEKAKVSFPKVAARR
jgi:hypothetical protein